MSRFGTVQYLCQAFLIERPRGRKNSLPKFMDVCQIALGVVGLNVFGCDLHSVYPNVLPPDLLGLVGIMNSKVACCTRLRCIDPLIEYCNAKQILQYDTT